MTLCARRADRHAQRDLASPSAEAHEQQIGDVAARYQQHERDGCEQSRECRT